VGRRTFLVRTGSRHVRHNLCNYISVDPHKESGQNLYRQYAGKKGKIVLHYRWVHECIRTGALQTFQNNWAGCKVTGTEKFVFLLTDWCSLY
jgi:hypothetical protein